MRDLEESVAFLTGVIGLTEIANPMGGTMVRWIEIGDGRRFHVQAGDVSVDLDYQNTGALVLNGGTIRNVSSQDPVMTLPAVGGGSSLAGQKAIVVDGVAPTVASVSVPANATYGVGQSLNFTVNFSEAVTVTGTPSIALTLDTGGTVAASYVSGSGTTALVFRHTVSAGTADSNGITVGSTIVSIPRDLHWRS